MQSAFLHSENQIDLIVGVLKSNYQLTHPGHPLRWSFLWKKFMSRYNTNNPVPSNQVKDFSDNAQIVDEIVHSQQATTKDRFGNDLKTWRGIQQDANNAAAAFGYIILDGKTFTTGATVNQNEILLNTPDAQYYKWTGVFPAGGKIVPANSTPQNTGGVGNGKWLGVGSQAAFDETKRAGAVGAGIQQAINNSVAGQTVLTINNDETVSSLSNEYGVEVDARRGRVFDTSGVQLSTYSNPRSKFVTGQEYLNYVTNKMIVADGVTASKKTYILWSGDSTVVGVNTLWPPASIGDFYAKRYGIIDVKNTALGHSGQSLYEWGYFYIDTEWSQHAAADLIILRWGINDPMQGYNLQQCHDALDRGLSKLRANKTVGQQSIIIMSPNSTSDTQNGRDEKWYEQLTALMRAKAKQYQCMFFDTYGMWQDSRSGAGYWLDNPYGDGRGIHPNDAFTAQIHRELFEYIYGPCAVINGSSNLFSNNGSSIQFIGSAYPPNTFHIGASWWRTDPADASWPLDGTVQVERFVDGVAVQKIYGYTSENTRVCFTRIGRLSENTWSVWRGLQNSMAGILQNSWAIGASRTGTYQKSIDGVVTISAVLTGGTTTAGTVIMTLPAGFRPKSDISYIPCGTNTAVGLINILANGQVTIQSFPSGSVLTILTSFPALVS